MSLETLATELRARREAKGWSQGGLAAEAGLDQGNISRIENLRQKSVDLAVVQKLAAALGCSVDALLGQAPPAGASQVGPYATAHLSRFVLSPYNERRSYDPDGIRDLAESIAERGLLQPLGAAPADPADPDGSPLQVDFGGRRLEALQLLEEMDRWPDDKLPGKEIPWRRSEGDEGQRRATSILENVQREDVSAYEEAQAFAELRDLDPERWTTDAIAAAIGKHGRSGARFVQLRLQLWDGCADSVKALLRDGVIGSEAALVFARAPALRQDEVAALVADGRIHSQHHLRDRLMAGVPPVGRNIFKLEEYDGPFLEPEEEGDPRLFADLGQFERLQEAAIEAKVAKLEKTHAWVEVVRAAWWYSGDYERDKTAEERGAIVHVDTDDYSVQVHKDLVKRQPRQAPAKAAGEKTPAPEFTKKHLAHAANLKTQALQRAVAGDVRLAKIAVCLGLMGCQRNVKIRSDVHRGEDRTLAPELSATFQAYAGITFGRHETSHVDAEYPLRVKGVVGYGYAGPDEKTEHQAYQALRNMPDADLDRLFAALVGAQVGTFNEYDPTLGDSPFVAALARDAGADVAAHWTIDDEYCATVRKPTLLKILEAAGPDAGATAEALAKKPRKALAELARDAAWRVLPAELQFGTAEDLADAEPVARDPAPAAAAAADGPHPEPVEGRGPGDQAGEAPSPSGAVPRFDVQIYRDEGSPIFVRALSPGMVAELFNSQPVDPDDGALVEWLAVNGVLVQREASEADDAEAAAVPAFIKGGK